MANSSVKQQSIIASVERPPSSSSTYSPSSSSFSTTTTTTATTTKLFGAPIPSKANQNNTDDSITKTSDHKNNDNTNTTTTTTTTNPKDSPSYPHQNSSNTNVDSDTNTTSAVISQLQQLQSPSPQLTTTGSTVTQLNKSRHRGLISQLFCCFRPSSANIYHDSNSIYNNTDNGHHHNSLTEKKYSGKYLLPARKESDNRICLVIDLDETLVHSSFKPIDNPDFIVPVEIDGTLHKVYVSKRPHVDEFLNRMGQIYECVLFTASLAKYADPVGDLLDPNNIFKARLFRESCAFYRGNYVKDLSRLGRDLNRVIIVDNSPASYIFHPDNALPVSSYFDNQNDNELLHLIPHLERLASITGSVVPISSACKRV